jgi:glutamyl-tRNA synthetase
MAPFVRFAPSPTGYLHVGNVRTALVNWLFARKAGGRFLLRLDDTDTARSKAEYEEAIREDLHWLGLHWDDFKKQSDRLRSYEFAREKLVLSGRLYPCYETAEELDIRRKLMAGRGLPPIYDRAALKLSDEEKLKLAASGRKPHYRFLLEDKPIFWNDMIRGETKFEGAHVSDPVLIRGEDHVSNTAVQLQIFEALGYAPPQLGHLALIKTKEGELSKRVGGTNIRGLRSAKLEPMAIVSLLAKLGTSDPVEPFPDMDALVSSFDITKFGRAAANYDQQELERLNEKLLHHLPFATVKAHIPFADEAFWLAVRGNIKTLGEVRQWWDIVHGEVHHPAGADGEYRMAAAALLPQAPWDETTWGVWTKAVSGETGRKGRELFLPLRLALTGVEHGPEMKLLLPMMHRDTVIRRLGIPAI